MAKAEEKQVVDIEKQQQIRALGGGSTQNMLKLPTIRIEHTLDRNSEANPLKGKFSLTEADNLGEFKTIEIGPSIKGHILLQRFRFNLNKSGEQYSSAEFNTETEIVKLFKSVGNGSDRKSELFAEGTPYDLGRQFLITGANGKTRSELIILFVLYIRLENGDLVKWKLNNSATFSYRGYERKLSPFTVTTEVTTMEKMNGSNKFYVPIFKAVEELTDYESIVKEIEDLRSQLGVDNYAKAEDSAWDKTTKDVDDAKKLSGDAKTDEIIVEDLA